MKFSRKQVSEIRDQYGRDGWTLQRLADKFSTSVSHIWRVVKNQIYFDLEYSPPTKIPVDTTLIQFWRRKQNLKWDRIRELEQQASGREYPLSVHTLYNHYKTSAP